MLDQHEHQPDKQPKDRLLATFFSLRMHTHNHTSQAIAQSRSVPDPAYNLYAHLDITIPFGPW